MNTQAPLPADMPEKERRKELLAKLQEALEAMRDSFLKK